MQIHPLMAGAAGSVIVVSLVGVAAITGHLPGSSATSEAKCLDCGVVVAVREVDAKGKGTGVGAVVGGVAGAVVGHELSHGRDVGTVAGAAGGALAGHEIERQVKTTKRFYVDVRMSDGTVKTVASPTRPALTNGDRVRLRDGQVVLRDARPGAAG